MRAVYGKVTMLEKIRPVTSETDHLFVGTDRYMYFTLSWDASSAQLKTEKSYVDLSDKTGRDSQSADRCLIDPTGRFMTLELFEGIITVVPIAQKTRRPNPPEVGTLTEPVPVRIEELFVRSFAYLHPRSSNPDKERPRLAILYEDNQQNVRVRVRTLGYVAGGRGELGSADLEALSGFNPEMEKGASHLIPLPAPICKLFPARTECGAHKV
jgi:DNA damage-binding protein 1